MALFPTALAQAIQVILKALSPVPKNQVTPGNDDHIKDTGLLSDLAELGPEDFKTLGDFAKVSATGEEDDNELFLERLVTLLAKLPPYSRTGRQLTDGLVNTLWDILEHPPSRTVHKDLRYREADGSNNNPKVPLLGAAGTSYARAVSGATFQNPYLPDAGLVFDSIMARGDESSFREHPNKISSILFYLGIIITHDCFQTDSKDHAINSTSSYLDLSPLYGRNEEEQTMMRTFKDGLLKPDCFSSKRVFGNPPGVGVILIMFNRFHNYVVTQLAHINEGSRFNKPESSYDHEAWKKYDNDLFQTGRLVTCGLYINVVLKDYEKKNAMNSRPAPMATGNQVSVEFNLIYRWHSATSLRDEKWATNLLRQALGGADPASATMPQMIGALRCFENNVPDQPEDRPFAGLEREADGTYSDDNLVEILSSSIVDIAGAFGANQVPSAMRAIELLGIAQSREWNVATLNEFRQYFGLKRHETFEDINPDPAVAGKLLALYDSPDAVELYPGIVAEKTKPPMSGSGICVGYTTSQAILSDAVGLVRGDRFYTVDYTPRNLTNWGYNEANFDLSVNQGHVMHKLIFRAFPNHFAYNSVYAHFPFVVPKENKIILESLGTAQQYSWARPERKLDPVVIKSHKAVSQILGNNRDYYVPWGEPISYLVSPPGKTFAKDFCLSGDASPNQQSRSHVAKCLYQPKEWESEIKKFFKLTSTNLLKKARQKLPPSPSDPERKGFEVDIIRDVIIPLNTRFVAEFFALPIKTTETSPHGIYTEQEKLLHYMLEGMRLRGTVVVARHVPNTRPAQNVTDDVPCLPDPKNPSGPSPISNPNRAASLRTYTIVPTQRAIVDLVTASHDPLAFPDPETLSLDRPLSSYLPWGAGPHKCLGDGITRVALAAAFKTIVGLPGLSRAPGPRGECRSMEFKEWRGQVGRKAVEGGGDEWTGLRVYLTPDQSRFSPVPTGMRIRWCTLSSRGGTDLPKGSFEAEWVDIENRK
ncbi:hypothetical protein AB5N19_10477 [Seiridium cardinale]